MLRGRVWFVDFFAISLALWRGGRVYGCTWEHGWAEGGSRMGTKMRAVVVSAAALLMAASCSSERRFGVDPAQSEMGLATVGTVVAPELVPTDLAPAFEVANAIGFPEGDIQVEAPEFNDHALKVPFNMRSNAAAVSGWMNALPGRLGCDEKVVAFAPDPSSGGDGLLGLDCRTDRGGYRFWITIIGSLGLGTGSAELIVGQYA
jgi:hypothetical protein